MFYSGFTPLFIGFHCFQWPPGISMPTIHAPIVDETRMLALKWNHRRMARRRHCIITSMAMKVTHVIRSTHHTNNRNGRQRKRSRHLYWRCIGRIMSGRRLATWVLLRLGVMKIRQDDEGLRGSLCKTYVENVYHPKSRTVSRCQVAQLPVRFLGSPGIKDVKLTLG